MAAVQAEAELHRENVVAMAFNVDVGALVLQLLQGIAAPDDCHIILIISAYVGPAVSFINEQLLRQMVHREVAGTRAQVDHVPLPRVLLKAVRISSNEDQLTCTCVIKVSRAFHARSEVKLAIEAGQASHVDMKSKREDEGAKAQIKEHEVRLKWLQINKHDNQIQFIS
mgnify:CR=1 FL=1